MSEIQGFWRKNHANVQFLDVQILDEVEMAMRGCDLREWRKRNGFTQDELRQELEIGSRQTVSSWERPENEVPRLVELALRALELDPTCRQRAGKKATAKERRDYSSGRDL